MRIIWMGLWVCLLMHPNGIIAQDWSALYEATEEPYVNEQWYEFTRIMEKATRQAEQEFGKEDSIYALALNDLALGYSLIDKNQKAEELFLKSYTIRKKLFDFGHENLDESLLNIGTLYSQTGRYKEAEKYLKIALLNKQSIIKNNPLHYVQFMEELGRIYLLTGRTSESKKFYERVVEYSRLIEEEKEYHFAMSIRSMAIFYKSIHQYDDAISLLIEARHILKEVFGLHHKTYLRTSLLLAETYFQNEKYKDAEIILEQNVKTVTEDGTEDLLLNLPAFSLIARVYQAQNKLPEISQKYFQKVINLYSIKYGSLHPNTLKARLHLARFHFTRSQYDEAINIYNDLLPKYQNFQTENFNYLGREERDSFYKELKSFYDEYTSVALLHHGEYPGLLSNMYDLNIRNKAILLNTTNKIKSQILESNDQNLIDLFNRTEEIRQFLGRATYLSDEELRTQRNIDRDSLREELRIKDQQITRLATFYNNESDNIGWHNIRDALGELEAAVEIIRTHSFDFQKGKSTADVQYIALIVSKRTKKEPTLVVLGNGHSIEKRAISSYRNSITYRIEDQHSYNLLWKPIQNRLKNIKTVYLSSDGAYHQINPVTLFDIEKASYLGEMVEIHQITNSKDILKKSEKPFSVKLAMLMGNPAFSKNSVESTTGTDQSLENKFSNVTRGEDLSPLPGAEKEVLLIADFLKSKNWEVVALLNEAAKESALKNMLRPDILHIATHGYFKNESSSDQGFEKNPYYQSGLLFTGAAKSLENQKLEGENHFSDDEDGILTAFEAVNLNISNTDLVVLSACETGLGSIRNGEGVYGMQRALTVAGARSILMSLWKVNDKTTMELMTSFYEHLLSGKSKRTSLQLAQNELRKEYNHPYYWGAFVLLGE